MLRDMYTNTATRKNKQVNGMDVDEYNVGV